MATGAPTRDEVDFGEVSRTVGVIFQYVLVAATLVGITSLIVLLLFVTNDALQPFTADAGWFLVYFLAFLLPVMLTMSLLARRGESAPSVVQLAAPYLLLAAGVAVGGGALVVLDGTLFAAVALFVATVSVIVGIAYDGWTMLLFNDRSGKVGLFTLGIGIAGAFLAGAVFITFEIIEPRVWFVHVLAAAAVTAVIYALHRTTGGLSTIPLAAAIVAGYGFALVGIPGMVPSLAEVLLRTVPVVPTRFIVYALTLALPAAGMAYAGVRSMELGRGDARAAALAALVVPVAGGVALAQVTGLAPASGLVVLLFGFVPVGYYAGTTLRHPERTGTDGLVLPVVVVGGALVGAAAVGALGFAGPESWLDWQFFTSVSSPFPEEAGIYPGLVGSVLLMLVVVLSAFPVGVGSAVYLEEYAPDNGVTRFIQVNISNLAGVPSVVYGLLGLGVFINLAGLGLGSVLVGGMTLALLILPIVVISAQEAIRSVPDDVRQASYGMGATRYQTVRNIVLPRALPGILTGTILAIGRAIGETAPLIMIAAPQSTFSIPSGLSDAASAMPLQIFVWATSSKLAFQDSVVAAGVVTVVVVLLVLNSTAIVLRNRFEADSTGGEGS